ncbi:Flp pilus assembly protein RcpC/CpaB [hydrothermal vent metagenome]|uniref:Flp pilus assembly protein RcpC/CpaB n=1 Tax=hydrothermal vent metagenome TaxID=652676 RepID=A0A3B0SZ40_9ZZZZ
MKPARIAVLFIAVAAAGGSAFIAKGMIGANDRSQVAAAPKLDTVDVLVANADINMGQSLSKKELKWQTWPRDAARKGYITKKAEPDALKTLQGTLANAPILAGEPINKAKLVLSDQSGFMSIVLPKGKRAISIRISPETGAGGFILPNNRVDVLLIRKQRSESGNGENVSVRTVLNNVLVRAIDQAWAEKDGKQVLIGKTATLELTPDETEALALAEAQGKLTLALRSLRDSDPAVAEKSKKRRKSASVTFLRYGKKTTRTQN